MTDDLLDRLAAYAPTAVSLAPEWSATEHERALTTVLDAPDVRERRLRFAPRPDTLRHGAIAPIAASVTVLALAGGVAVVAGRDLRSNPATTPTSAAGVGVSVSPTSGVRSFDATLGFHATVDTPLLGAHQWAYRAVTGRYAPDQTSGSSAEWVAQAGIAQRLVQTDEQPDLCVQVHGNGKPDFDDPTQAFVDALPTDPDALKAYLMTRVQGSTSREEAIFTAIGDLLSTGDLLASSAQRAAMVTVLAGLRRTSVHDDVDERGRPSIRVDFVDPNQRPAEVQSMYFDPRTFQLLEKRESYSALGVPVPTDEPSAPYTSEPTERATSPQRLPAEESITVMTDERVVNSLSPTCGGGK